MKKIILIRHFESQKNINNTFSSLTDTEELTKEAIIELNSLSEIYNNLIDCYDIKNVYSANSFRTINSAKNLSKKTSILQIEDFKSIKYKSFSVSEADAKKIDPLFINGLELYRKGLFSSYDIETPNESESVRDFEDRIIKSFNKIINDSDEKLLIFFLHRSPITAILINIARQFYNYPKDFFGYIELNLGYATLLTMNDNKLIINNVNNKLEKIIKNCLEQCI